MSLSTADRAMVMTLKEDTEVDLLEVKWMMEELRCGRIDELQYNRNLVAIYERIAERDEIFDEIKSRNPRR